ncbi:MAG: LD-carboxypeptidase [Phycisphaerales bacterium]|nr:MAG: LD-carboxypeptidase [Phycisphaerales bacterium]
MSKPKIHLLAIAGTCRGLLEGLGFRTARELIRFVQQAVGEGYRVTGNARLIEAPEDDYHGGRDDDAARATDFQRCLADDATAAAVTLRGGAWLTRILPCVNFDVLKRRRTGVALFGFSEITTAINIAGRYRRAYSFYDLGPGFLRAGMSEYARRSIKALQPEIEPGSEAADAFADGWGSGQFRTKFAEFFRDVVGIVEGRGTTRSVTGTLVAGRLPARTSATFIGGNLACMLPLLGTPYAKAVDPADRWIVIEDVNEAPDRIDRMLGHLTLAGFWSRCRGVMLGDFHDKDGDQRAAVLALLKHHFPKRRELPVVATRDVGHIWPIAPLPVGRPVELVRTPTRRGRPVVHLRPPWADWAIR